MPVPIMGQPWSPILSLQLFRISAWQSASGLSERRQAAICSCRTAIFSRDSLVTVVGAEGGVAAREAAPITDNAARVSRVRIELCNTIFLLTIILPSFLRSIGHDDFGLKGAVADQGI